MGMFDGLPMPPDKPHLKDELSRIDENWAAARFDSLPHVVEILTGKDRETELQALREHSECIEAVVDEVVEEYHNGFNRAIQNYSQILRLFSESAEIVDALRLYLPEAKMRLAARNKQLHQFWYRSVTLRHIISLLDQIERISKIPARIEKLMAEKQFYAVIQLHIQSALMLEREGLQSVGALQDVRTALKKLRAELFQKVMEDLHAHLYNKGEYSSNDGETEEGALGQSGTLANGSTQASDYKSSPKENNVRYHPTPPWLSAADPDQFLEAVTKSDAAHHVKYLQTMVECLCKLGKVASAGAMICQQLRPTVHEILTSKIKKQAELGKSSGTGIAQVTNSSLTLQYLKGQIEIHHIPKPKHQSGVSNSGALLAVSPVTPGLAPNGPMQAAAKELLNSIFNTLSKILENLVIVGELLESKASQQIEMDPQNPAKEKAKSKRNPDSDESQATGGFNVGFSLTVLQSECQQLICEFLRATPEAASADAAVQTARLASQVPSKEERDGSEDGLTFAFRFTDATLSIANQGWGKKNSSKLREKYGSVAVLPEQGIYLAAAVYRPVTKFTDKLASFLPQRFCQLGNDGLLAFIENFVKDHFLPEMFVDYRKSVQQAISSPSAFRPRAHASASYSPYVKKGRPVLQGLLAIDLLAKELLGWAQGMPRFAAELMKFVQALFERAYERCRTSYMEAVLEKQCYMLVGRHDFESLMRLDPASVCLTNSPASVENNASDDAYGAEVEMEMSDLLLSLRPVKQENLIRDDNKLILLASLSDSLEYVADSIERIAPIFTSVCDQVDDKINPPKTPVRKEATEKDLALFADDYRKLAVDCLKILRIEMQLDTVFHMQEMTSREYMDDQDAEEPDDFIISLTTQITRRDEEIAPFVAGIKRSYMFGGICSVAAYASIKALAEMKSINLFGVQQICRNSIALEQALAALPSVNSKAVQNGLDRVRTYYELLNMPFEALLAFIPDHEHLFSDDEYYNLLKVQIPGREIPADAQSRISDTLFR